MIGCKDALAALAKIRLPGWMKTLRLAVQLVIFFWISYKLLQISYFDKGDSSKFTNRYCVQTECDLDYKFDKVVYFWLDGISWDTAQPIFDLFDASHTNLFRVAHDAIPWSGAVFSTYMTGKTGKNMGLVQADNIVYQMMKTGKNVYLASEESVAYVVYGLDNYVDDNQLSFYPDVVSDDETDEVFGWLFDCDQGDNAKCFNSVMDKVKSEDRSIFFETFYIDHILHFKVDDRWNPYVLQKIAALAWKLQYVKQWIDQNPDYLLVLVSDHGGKVPGDDLHGPFKDPNNYAWNLYYNPTINSTVSFADAPLIRARDVCATFWQYLAGSGVSIPAESVGVVGSISADPVKRMNALKINAMQLVEYAKYVGLNRIPSMPTETGDMTYDIQEMEEYVHGLSEKCSSITAVKPLFIITILLILFQLYRIVKGQLFESDYSVRIILKRFGWYIPGAYILAVCLARYTAGYMWEGGSNFKIYIYVILLLTGASMGVVSKAKKGAKATVSKSSTKPKYISLRVYNDTDNDNDQEQCNTENEIVSASTHNQRTCVASDSTSLVDLAFQRDKTFFLVLLKYIFGMCPVKTLKPSVSWVMWYAVGFGCICTFVFGLYMEPFFTFSSVQGIPYRINAVALINFVILFIEFRWQRKLIYSHIEKNRQEEDTGKISWFLKKFVFSEYLPLNMKMILYYVLIFLVFKYHESVSTNPLTTIPWVIYYVCFAHIVILLFLDVHIQRDLLLPLYTLTLLLASPLERAAVSYMVLTLLPLSNTLCSGLEGDHKKKNVANRHILPYIAMLMIVTAHFVYAFISSQEYTTNTVDLVIPGVSDVTVYPIFSVAMMLFHKMSFFILVVPFLIRLATPNPPPLTPLSFKRFTFAHITVSSLPCLGGRPPKGGKEGVDGEYGTLEDGGNDKDYCGDEVQGERRLSAYKSDDSNNVVVFDMLIFFGCVTVLFYLVMFLQKALDEGFLWTMSASVIVSFYGVTLLVSKVVGDITSSSLIRRLFSRST